MRRNDSVRAIKGVGEKAEQCFGKLNIETVGDLLEHYPRGYDEWKPIQQVSSVSEGETAALEGVLASRPTLKNFDRLKVLSADLQDASGAILVTWYNMPFLRSQLKMGTRYILRGKVGKKRGRLVIEQPKIYKKEEFYRQVGKLRPIYPLTAGLTNNMVIKAMEAAVRETEGLNEYLPSPLRKRQGLVEYKKALRQIHFPADKEELRQGRKRLVFDELFLYQLALSYIRKRGREPSSHKMEVREEIGQFVEGLPFALTNAQKRVFGEIEKDLTDGFVMNRLVQGDVGSGKTVVAVMALYLTALNGGQGAFMAPTEVLASQHYKNLCGMFADRGVRVGLLTGSLTAKQKREAKEKIALGEWDVVVGTHAILQDNVVFANLALVITDEQHRFGVKQREELFEKGREPHVLAMSATPIPRTLALVLYGDMDLSVMDEQPADRLPIKNCVVNTDYRPNAYGFMKKQIDAGHQVYIICPMVEESEESELESVSIYTEQLREIFPPGVKVDSLHGKMRPRDKEDVMERFSRGETDILVSTTVIEVGIDVPNATVMMIENAERFGLAQLHQLRGRVGRGDAQSYCILMRGQGDLFGVRQSGEELFALADVFEDAEILTQAAKEAEAFAEEDIRLLCAKNKRLKERVERYLGQVTL